MVNRKRWYTLTSQKYKNSFCVIILLNVSYIAYFILWYLRHSYQGFSQILFRFCSPALFIIDQGKRSHCLSSKRFTLYVLSTDNRTIYIYMCVYIFLIPTNNDRFSLYYYIAIINGDLEMCVYVSTV